MISVFIALIIRILINPFSNVYQKQLTQGGISPLYVNFCTYIILALISLLLLPWTNWYISSFAAFGLYAILVGFLGAVGNGLLIKAFEKGNLSILGPINSYKSIVGLFVGILVLKEYPNFWSVLGILLIVVGSYFVLSTKPKLKFSFSLFKNKEIQYRLGAMVFAAIEAVFIKKMILLSTVYLSFLAWCVFGAFFAYILLKLFKVNSVEQKNKIDNDLGLKLLLLVVCVGLMQFTTNYVFENMDVAYALSLFQLSSIVSIFLGYKIFKEKNILNKLIGASIMVAGSCLIILMN